MSNALAIASVTAVLKDLLINGVIDHHLTSSVGEVLVTALPPDQIALDKASAKSQLNLFLYHVSLNPGWRNVGLPSHSSNGDRMRNPPLALDLHYLLTAYGAEELHAEILLGYGMQWLHETPVLARDAIRFSLAPPSPVTGSDHLPASLQALVTSELAEQVELIKITPQTLSSEETSKLWTAFQAKYRPTAAYQVSVVLIQSKRPTRSPLPVKTRKLYIVPFRNPVIDELKSQEDDTAAILPNQPILPGHNLVIVGRQLQGDDLRLNVGGLEAIPDSAKVSDTQIILPIPADLLAGIQGVQVIHRRLLGDPPVPHGGVRSNLAAFVFRPQIDSIEATDVTDAESGGGLRAANVNLTVQPPIGENQRVILLLNELPPPLASPPEPSPSLLAYTFEAPSMALVSPPLPTPTLTIPITDVAPGTYVARVQVGGAESLLTADADGVYNSPQLTIP